MLPLPLSATHRRTQARTHSRTTTKSTNLEQINVIRNIYSDCYECQHCIKVKTCIQERQILFRTLLSVSLILSFLGGCDTLCRDSPVNGTGDQLHLSYCLPQSPQRPSPLPSSDKEVTDLHTIPRQAIVHVFVSYFIVTRPRQPHETIKMDRKRVTDQLEAQPNHVGRRYTSSQRQEVRFCRNALVHVLRRCERQHAFHLSSVNRDRAENVFATSKGVVSSSRRIVLKFPANIKNIINDQNNIFFAADNFCFPTDYVSPRKYPFLLSSLLMFSILLFLFFFKLDDVLFSARPLCRNG